MPGPGVAFMEMGACRPEGRGSAQPRACALGYGGGTEQVRGRACIVAPPGGEPGDISCLAVLPLRLLPGGPAQAECQVVTPTQKGIPGSAASLSLFAEAARGR